MKAYLFIVTLSISIYFQTAFAGNPGKAVSFPGNVKGIVKDSSSAQPIEYANIALYSLPDSALISGTMTDSTGKFMLNNVAKGNYFIKVMFIGYQNQISKSFTVNSENKNIELGELGIAPSQLMMKGAEIMAEKSPISFKLDKQVIDADKVLNAANGTAIDVLQNSPSISVDNDGNISLRGSNSFTLLINNKPTVLDAKTALRQIATSSVARIEIITNPSAKYDAEGTSGIINIMLKSKRNDSFGGIVNTRYETLEKYSADASFGLSQKKWSLNGKVAWSSNTSKPDSKINRYYLTSDTLKAVMGDFIRTQAVGNTTINLDMDYTPSKNNQFGISFEGGNSIYKTRLETYYTEEWFNKPSNYSFNDFNMDITGNYWNTGVNYRHQFDTATHYLDFNFMAMQWAGHNNEDNDIYPTDVNRTNGSLIGIHEFREKINQMEYQAKVDYSYALPIGFTVEAGYMYTGRPNSSNFVARDYVSADNSWTIDTLATSKEDFNIQKHAAYLTLSGSAGSFEYQAGIRAEQYDRDFNMPAIEKEFKYSDLSWFPSAHLSYSFKNKSQLQASYSRRVEYPEDFVLSPTPIFKDKYVYQTGNPNLKAQFTDSYELNFIQPIKSAMISLNAYYRQVNNAFSRSFTYRGDGMLILSWDNMAVNKYIGMEVGANIPIGKKLSVNASGNVYYADIRGNLGNSAQAFTDASFTSRLMINYKIFTNTRLQLSGFYNGAAMEDQGKREGMGLVGISVRQDFLKKQLSLTVGMPDIFGSFTYKYITSDPVYRSEINFHPEYPVFNIGLSYKINNFKAKPSQQNNGGGMNVGGI
ncbi:MAG: outer membrane beta-barrel family protein [Bacteroidota bacterium]